MDVELDKIVLGYGLWLQIGWVWDGMEWKYLWDGMEISVSTYSKSIALRC